MRIRAFSGLCSVPVMTVALLTGWTAAEEPTKPTPPAAAAAAVKEIEAGDLKLSVPETWKPQKSGRAFRLAEFLVPAAEGDTAPTEYVITPPIGGTREANIARWIGQFDGAGRELVMSKGKCPQGDYILVQLSGTFKRPIGPPIQTRGRDPREINEEAQRFIEAHSGPP